MNGTTPVVRIGASGARILAVTGERIDYLDEAGQHRSIDLAECDQNWGRWRNARSHEFRPLPGATEERVAAWNSRCVGRRGALDHPPWAEFLTEPQTRLEFATSEALYGELLAPLRQAGWHTFDTD
jgi:hypothetical protein